MKKMFFTAIAVIAFSGVSMANTIEEKKDETTISDENALVVSSECENLASAQGAIYEKKHGCQDSEMYNDLWFGYYAICEFYMQ